LIMDKVQLKKLLKPLIKECIKEVIFEDGVLSGIVSEVAHGMNRAPLLEGQKISSAPPTEDFRQMREKSHAAQKQKITANKKKLLDAIGTEAYNGVNLFEGTTPLASAAPAPGAPPSVQGPLASVAAADPGVDITNLFGTVGHNWKAHMGSGK